MTQKRKRIHLMKRHTNRKKQSKWGSTLLCHNMFMCGWCVWLCAAMNNVYMSTRCASLILWRWEWIFFSVIFFAPFFFLCLNVFMYMYKLYSNFTRSIESSMNWTLFAAVCVVCVCDLCTIFQNRRCVYNIKYGTINIVQFIVNLN